MIIFMENNVQVKDENNKNDLTFIQTENTCLKSELERGNEQWNVNIRNGKILVKDNFYMLIVNGEKQSYNSAKFKGNSLVIYGYKDIIEMDT